MTQIQINQFKLYVPSGMSFDSGRYNIKPNLQPVLGQFAQGLNSQPNSEVSIVDHTDSTGNDAVNQTLMSLVLAGAHSDLRANSKCSTTGGAAKKGPTIARHSVNNGDCRKPTVWSSSVSQKICNT